MYILSTDDTTQIEIIRKAVATSNCELLDLKPERPDMPGRALDLLTATEPCQVYHADIPLSSVSGMHRADFWRQGQSFREILQWNEEKKLGVHGKGWQPDIFEYMEGELREKEFPAHSTLHQMRLISRGGIVDCENGNHRFVGAYCWLAAKYGHRAVFKKAHVTHHPISKPLLDKLVEIDRENYKIDVLFQSDQNRRRSVILRVRRGREILHMTYNPTQQDFFVERSRAPTLLARLLKYLNDEKNEGWCSVSHRLIQKMAMANWVYSSTLERLDESHRPVSHS